MLPGSPTDCYLTKITASSLPRWCARHDLRLASVGAWRRLTRQAAGGTRPRPLRLDRMPASCLLTVASAEPRRSGGSPQGGTRVEEPPAHRHLPLELAQGHHPLRVAAALNNGPLASGAKHFAGKRDLGRDQGACPVANGQGLTSRQGFGDTTALLNRSSMLAKPMAAARRSVAASFTPQSVSPRTSMWSSSSARSTRTPCARSDMWKE